MAEMKKKRFKKKNTETINLKTSVEPKNINFKKPKLMDMQGKSGFIRYQMPKEMALGLLRAREKEEKKMDIQEYLCKIVNDHYGLKGYCVEVLVH